MQAQVCADPRWLTRREAPRSDSSHPQSRCTKGREVLQQRTRPLLRGELQQPRNVNAVCKR
eukprot:8151165-Alexandrium_andersonii.AAC.1